ncbi:hypothetical protein AB6A40_009783 [Gnathostoma spinigerum]|uniref:Uncharacterized protein n=1 Tax=Gnathostoma spinigerum TaxID=75299 RepID=A0ABD6F083_9BILA
MPRLLKELEDEVAKYNKVHPNSPVLVDGVSPPDYVRLIMEDHEKRRRQQTQTAERLTNRIPSSVCQTTFMKTGSRTRFPTRIDRLDLGITGDSSVISFSGVSVITPVRQITNEPATSSPFVSVSSAKSRSKITKIPSLPRTMRENSINNTS